MSDALPASSRRRRRRRSCVAKRSSFRRHKFRARRRRRPLFVPSSPFNLRLLDGTDGQPRKCRLSLADNTRKSEVEDEEELLSSPQTEIEKNARLVTGRQTEDGEKCSDEMFLSFLPEKFRKSA